MAWAVATNNFWAAVLAMTLPRMLRAFTSVGTFGFYAGLNFLAFWMIFFWLPETKQKTLEELDYVFAVPTRTHMKYQAKEVGPYWVKRHIFRKKGLREPQLYKFDADDIPAPTRTLADELHEKKLQQSDKPATQINNGAAATGATQSAT